MKPREPSPKKFSSSSGSKDYKSRVPYEKRDTYPPKRERDYEAERSHPPSSISRGSSNMNVFNMDRERDVRDPRPRDTSSGMPNNKYSSVYVDSSSNPTRFNGFFQDPQGVELQRIPGPRPQPALPVAAGRPPGHQRPQAGNALLPRPSLQRLKGYKTHILFLEVSVH